MTRAASLSIPRVEIWLPDFILRALGANLPVTTVLRLRGLRRNSRSPSVRWQTGRGVSDVLMIPLLRITVTKNPSGEWSVTITLGFI